MKWCEPRYALTSEVTALGKGEDPCQSADCGPLATCLVEGATFRQKPVSCSEHPMVQVNMNMATSEWEELQSMPKPSKRLIDPKIIKGINNEQGLFLLSSTGQIQNFRRSLFASYTPFCYNQLLVPVFRIMGWWVTVYFDSQCKSVWGKTRAPWATYL